MLLLLRGNPLLAGLPETAPTTKPAPVRILFDTDMQTGLQSIGIDSDSAFATKVGTNGDYHYVRKTQDEWLAMARQALKI